MYDSLKESEKPKLEERKQRKSRYIEGLLDKAKERNKEQDIIYERQCALHLIFTHDSLPAVKISSAWVG